MTHLHGATDFLSLADLEFAQRCFDALSKHWVDDGDRTGMHRPGYSDQETEAMDMICARAVEQGMEVYEDVAGNRFLVTRDGDDTLPVRLMGSHLDAVPQGGAFDGPAGVVAAITALRSTPDGAMTLSQKAGVVIWRNEESPWFKQFAVGSKLATGRLGMAFLKSARQRETDMTLDMAVAGQTIDTERFATVQSLRGATFPTDSVAGFVEAHIEQETTLDELDMPLGLVTGIAGNIRFPEYIEFYGRAAHTGTTRMDKRHSAERTARDFLNRLDASCTKIADRGELVWEVVDHHVVNPSQTSVPAHVRLNLDIRSTRAQDLDAAMSAIIAAADNVCAKHGTTWNREGVKPQRQAPVMMDEGLRSALYRAASKARFSLHDMPSWAGHDAMVTAEAGIPSAMLFMKHNGISHNPLEDLPAHSFAAAVRVLREWIYSPPVEKRGREGGFTHRLITQYGGQKLSL